MRTAGGWRPRGPVLGRPAACPAGNAPRSSRGRPGRRAVRVRAGDDFWGDLLRAADVLPKPAELASQAADALPALPSPPAVEAAPQAVADSLPIMPAVLDALPEALPTSIPQAQEVLASAASSLPSSPGEAAHLVADLVQLAGGWAAGFLPEQAQPLLLTLATDVHDTLLLQPSLATLARLAAIYYGFFTQPSPAFGIVDFYVLNPLDSLLRRRFSVPELTLRERLGGGNYGQVFEGIQNKGGQRIPAGRELSREEKKRRVVLKRVNSDTVGVRTNFLRSGTIAQGAAETGLAEGYMCSRLMRDPVARLSAAKYLGSFTAERSEGGFTTGSQWLVWRFESDATLATALSGQLGPFPECLEGIMLGKETGTADSDKRRAAVVRVVMRRLLKGLRRIHKLGLVHRDVKPENVLITTAGEVKVIDFGAAVDMCTGINFNPKYGMLDPRYSPPEELVMPRSFPRAPIPALSALLSPLAWLYGRPDLFDSYSAGVMLLQLAVPELRSVQASRVFNTDLARLDYDLNAWRRQLRTRYDFSLLDRRRGTGWDLACKLVCKRNRLNRGRMSVSAALRHPFFLPEIS